MLEIANQTLNPKEIGSALTDVAQGKITYLIFLKIRFIIRNEFFPWKVRRELYEIK
jgi:hypothetical protein